MISMYGKNGKKKLPDLFNPMYDWTKEHLLLTADDGVGLFYYKIGFIPKHDKEKYCIPGSKKGIKKN